MTAREVVWRVYLEQGQHDLPSMLAKLARDRAAGLVTVDAKVLAGARARRAAAGAGADSTYAAGGTSSPAPLQLQLQSPRYNL